MPGPRRVSGPNTLSWADCDYEERPDHRGHTVKVEDWNEEYVMLVIQGDTKDQEALIPRKALKQLAYDC